MGWKLREIRLQKRQHFGTSLYKCALFEPPGHLPPVKPPARCAGRGSAAFGPCSGSVFVTGRPVKTLFAPFPGDRAKKRFRVPFWIKYRILSQEGAPPALPEGSARLFVEGLFMKIKMQIARLYGLEFLTAFGLAQVIWLALLAGRGFSWRRSAWLRAFFTWSAFCARCPAA